MIEWLNCPLCKKPLDYDEVDVGVGVMRGNFRCACGWSEGSGEDERLDRAFQALVDYVPEPEDD